MRSYAKGRWWEWKVKRQWEAEGYVVKRVAGSKGTADLVAVKDSQVYFIQVKVNRKPTQSELDKLTDECAACGAFPVVVVWDAKKRRLDTLFL